MREGVEMEEEKRRVGGRDRERKMKRERINKGKEGEGKKIIKCDPEKRFW